jgi:hypothetical protein
MPAVVLVVMTVIIVLYIIIINSDIINIVNTVLYAKCDRDIENAQGLLIINCTYF